MLSQYPRSAFQGFCAGHQRQRGSAAVCDPNPPRHRSRDPFMRNPEISCCLLQKNWHFCRDSGQPSINRSLGTTPIFQRTPWGGGKRRGVENLTNDTRPKKGFWTPPRTVRFPPPSGVSTLFFLYKNPRQSRPEALLDGSKNFRENAFSGTFSSPHTFCTPPYHGPNFRKKRSRSEKAILGALGEFRGILGAALRIGNSILGIRNSILGMASHDLINTKPTILGATLGAIPGIAANPPERFSFAPAFSERFFKNWGGPRAPDIRLSWKFYVIFSYVPLLLPRQHMPHCLVLFSLPFGALT